MWLILEVLLWGFIPYELESYGLEISKPKWGMLLPDINLLYLEIFLVIFGFLEGNLGGFYVIFYIELRSDDPIYNSF